MKETLMRQIIARQDELIEWLDQDCPEELDEEGDDVDVGDLGWPYDGTDDGER